MGTLWNFRPLSAPVQVCTCAKVRVYAVVRAPHGRRAHHGLTRARHTRTRPRPDRHANIRAAGRRRRRRRRRREYTASAPPQKPPPPSRVSSQYTRAHDTRAFAARADDTRRSGRRRRRIFSSVRFRLAVSDPRRFLISILPLLRPSVRRHGRRPDVPISTAASV